MAERDRTRALSPQALRALVEHSGEPRAVAEQAPTEVYVRAVRRDGARPAITGAVPSARVHPAAAATRVELAGRRVAPGMRRHVSQHGPRRLLRLALWASAGLLGLASLLAAWRWVWQPSRAVPALDAEAVAGSAEAGASAEVAAAPAPSASQDEAPAATTGAPPSESSPAASDALDSVAAQQRQGSAARAVQALGEGELATARDLYLGLAQATGEPVYAGLARVLQRQLSCLDGAGEGSARCGR